MRVLHAAVMLRPPSGIINQMRWEREAACELGLDWSVKIFCPSGWAQPENIIVNSKSVTAGYNGFLRKIYAWLRIRIEYYFWVMNNQHDFDVFLIRYSVHDPFQFFLLKRLKSINKEVYTVHHTLETPELKMMDGIIGNIRSVFENIIGYFSLKNVTGIVGVTNEIVQYERSRVSFNLSDQIVYPNGISYIANTENDCRKDKPELLFIASFFSEWHGLDLLIDSVKKSKKDFILHVVGEVSDQDYKSIVEDDRILLHGRLSKNEISSLSRSCWLGLGSFALERKSMAEACTLKVREYLKNGIPVYSGHTDVFPISFPFYRCGAVDIISILDYAYLMRNIEKGDIANESKKYIDKKYLTKSLYEDLC